MAYKFKEWNPNEETTRHDAKRKEYETPYTDPDSVKALYNKATDYETNNNPGEWDTSKYQAVIDASNAWNNRAKFSYDLNGDALYQQYKDKFINQGRLAMADTMGQASAMTGGYGSSYAVTAGNQAYQSHLQNLNDIVPQLYQMAYERYTQEGQDLLNKYNMASDMYENEYGEHMDKTNIYNTTLDRLYNRADTERGFEYGKWDADRTYYSNAYNDAYTRDFTAHNTNETNAFNAYQQSVNEQYQKDQLAISQAQLKLQQDAANAPKVQGLTVEESIEVYNTVDAMGDDYEKIDKYIDGLAISEEEKGRLWKLYLPASYLYGGLQGDSANTTFHSGVGLNKTATMKN